MALSHSPKIVTDGLILQFDPGNTRSYPGTGSAVSNLRGLGPELVPQQPFTNSAVWPRTSTEPLGFSYRSFNTGAGGIGISAANVLTIGRRYRVRIILSTCTGTFELRNSLLAFAGNLILTATSPGTYEVEFVANNVNFYLRAATALTVEFREVSIREVNNGTLNNSTFSASNGGILSYNGTSGRCVIEPLPQSINAAFSVFAFVKLAAAGDLFGVWGHDDPTGGLSCHFEVRTGGMRVRLGNVDRLCPSLAVGSWKYIGFTTNINDHSYYVDGVLTDSWTGAKGAILGAGTLFQPAFAASRAAGTDLAPDRTFNGDISVCQIYNRALTAAEIQQNFNAVRSRFGI